MADEVRLSADTRTEFGKGASRRTRRDGKVPAVVYGGGADPKHVALPAHELAAAIRNGGSNVLLTLLVWRHKCWSGSGSTSTKACRHLSPRLLPLLTSHSPRSLLQLQRPR